MKITIVGPVYPYRGGIAHYTTFLAEALMVRHHVQVISFRRQYPAWLYPGQSDKDPSHIPLKVNAKFTLDPLNPWTWRHTAIEIKEFKPDLVILPWWTTFWAPAFAGLGYMLDRKNIPMIYIVHNVLPHEARLWDLRFTCIALGRAKAFITGTPQEKKRLLSIIPGAYVRVHPHPVYTIFSSQRIPRQEAKKRLGLVEEQPVLLFFGIVRPYKGVDILLEALARLHSQGLYPTLLVAGEFWENKNETLRRISSLAITAQVHLEDRYIPNEDVALYFSAADVFVAPYSAGSQSGSLKIALGFELPAIASRTIADDNLLSMEGKGIYIIPPGDVEALANAIYLALQRRSEEPAQYGKLLDHGGWDSLVNSIELVAQTLIAS